MRYTHVWPYRRILGSRRFLAALRSARRNVLADLRGDPPPAGPYMAELDVTYRCNCACRMCQRWRDPRRDELPLTRYRDLSAELAAMGTHQISVAGGEPLMRADVFEIIAAFAAQGLSVNLCTNGMLLERHLQALWNCGATCITVSLDGATAACHDAIRRAAGGFERVVAGVDALLQRPAGQRPVVRVRITVSNRNMAELRRFYARWAGRADDVLVQPVHTCTEAFYTGTPAAEQHLDGRALAAQIEGTPLGSADYLQRLIGGLVDGGGFPRQRCFAGSLMARIDPWGNVYPCLEQRTRVGSIRRAPFARVWRTAAFQRERRRLATDRTCACWYNNTAMIGHFGRLLARTSLAGRRRPAGDRVRPAPADPPEALACR